MSDQLVVMGSRLRLQSPRHLVRFLRGTRAINRQLRSSPGLVDSKLRAQFGKLTFWTLSSWESEEALQRFARSGPHAAVVGDLRRRGAMRSGDFAFWTIERGSRLPRWDEVERRVNDAVAARQQPTPEPSRPR
ncbi:MAG TPA: hypothetical protein VF183_10030 [Acidimicrobiales bacterium]